MSSPGWNEIEESAPLMKELMAALVSNKKGSAPGDESHEK
jgi:hypothetical protein